MEVMKTDSKKAVSSLVDTIGDDKELFAQLMDFFLQGDLRLSQRASWVVGHCADKHPQLMAPYLDAMIDALESPLHDAAKRNIVRIFQGQDFSEDLIGRVYDRCFRFLASMQEPIAVRVFSMTVLANICKKYPDLAMEVIPVIEAHMPMGSAGFKSRGRRTLKLLHRLSANG